eukprot:scaffold116384_cov53-Attheya_sp.AAC.1
MKFRFLVVELSALSVLVAGGWELDGRCYHWICGGEESPRVNENKLKWNNQMCDCLSGECDKNRGLRAQVFPKKSYSTDHLETVDDVISEKEFEEIRGQLDEFDEMLEEAVYEIEQGSDKFDKILQESLSESDEALYEFDELLSDYLEDDEFESSNQDEIGRVLNHKKKRGKQQKKQQKKEEKARKQREEQAKRQREQERQRDERERQRADQERQRAEQEKKQEEERRVQEKLRTIGRKPPEGVKLKLHWHKWSCWQYEMIPRYWCVYAQNMPGSRAYKVYLDNCNRNMNSMGWDFRPVPMKSNRNLLSTNVTSTNATSTNATSTNATSTNATSTNATSTSDVVPMTNNTFQIRNTAHNLCMSASENPNKERYYQILLRVCDENNSNQIFSIDEGKDIWGDTMCTGEIDSCFEIHPFDDPEICLDNPHHPRSGERLGMKPCKVPQAKGHQTHRFEIELGI